MRRVILHAHKQADIHLFPLDLDPVPLGSLPLGLAPVSFGLSILRLNMLHLRTLLADLRSVPLEQLSLLVGGLLCFELLASGLLAFGVLGFGLLAFLALGSGLLAFWTLASGLPALGLHGFDLICTPSDCSLGVSRLLMFRCLSVLLGDVAAVGVLAAMPRFS